MRRSVIDGDEEKKLITLFYRIFFFDSAHGNKGERQKEHCVENSGKVITQKNITRAVHAAGNIIHRPVAHIVNDRCESGKYEGRDNIVAHDGVYESSADKAHRQQIKGIEACPGGGDIPKRTGEKTEKHSVNITLKHSHADHGGNKQQSPDAENLRKEAVSILKNRQQQQNQCKAKSAGY